MQRRLPHLLTLLAFLATASGAVLSAHESLQGAHHDSQHCSICQDLLVGSHAVLPVSTTAPAVLLMVVVLLAVAAQRPVIPALLPAVAPRAPPTV